MQPKRVGILVFNKVEVLDFCGPFEVFSVTRLDEARRREDPSPFEVVLIAESLEMVVATGGLKVQPDYTIDNVPRLDILVVPGGGEHAPRYMTSACSASSARAPRKWKR